MKERKAEIPVNSKLRDRLRVSKGEKTWDEYLEYLESLGKKLGRDAQQFGRGQG